MLKKVSVIIPAYNYAHVLPRAIKSVALQLAEDCELIVIDDGSTDDTPQVISQLQNQFPGQIRTERKNNGGLASVRNRGIELANSDWFIFLDADDEMVDGALKNICKHLEANPDSRFVIGGHISVSDGGKFSQVIPDQLAANPVERVRNYLLDKKLSLSNGACVMHREIFKHGLYPEHFRNAEDIPVFAQALAHTNCVILKEPLAIIHKHSTSLRHNVQYDMGVGMQLVDEVFETGRLGPEFKELKEEFISQRALSLFRGYYVAKMYEEAKRMYRIAIANRWTSVFKMSYTRKFIRIIFK